MPSPSETKTGPETSDGGPAFPGGYTVDVKDRGPVAIFSGGMTLRDWFAGQALAGMLADPDVKGEIGSLARTLSADSYAIADSMLATRMKVRS